MSDEPERYVLRQKFNKQCRPSSDPHDSRGGMRLHKTFATAKEASDWINENCLGAAFECEEE